MKSLLWVTAIEPCFDADGGGQIRQAHLLDALADRFAVRLLLAGRLQDERIRERLHSVTEVPVGLAEDPEGKMRRRWRDIRWEIVEHSSDEVARHKDIRHRLRPHVDSSPADIVCVEYIGLAPLLPRQRRGFWALTLHNLPSEMARHAARIARGRRQRLMLALEERNSRRVEQWASSAYDLVIAVSHEDASKLSGGVRVVPNGVDTTRFQPAPIPSNPRVVFTGALHTLPNRDGILWFCRDVWPSVRQRVTGATLDIVGAEPPAEVIALGQLDGVTVHADVPDVVPFLSEARVAIVPLRIGSGSRLKALEAMAAGRAVVGTAVGLGGLEVQPDRDVLVADEPGAFADALARCLTDDELAERLGVMARACVQAYSWNRIARDYADLLQSAV